MKIKSLFFCMFIFSFMLFSCQKEDTQPSNAGTLNSSKNSLKDSVLALTNEFNLTESDNINANNSISFNNIKDGEYKLCIWLNSAAFNDNTKQVKTSLKFSNEYYKCIIIIIIQLLL